MLNRCRGLEGPLTQRSGRQEGEWESAMPRLLALCGMPYNREHSSCSNSWPLV